MNPDMLCTTLTCLSLMYPNVDFSNMGDYALFLDNRSVIECTHRLGIYKCTPLGAIGSDTDF